MASNHPGTDVLAIVDGSESEALVVQLLAEEFPDMRIVRPADASRALRGQPPYLRILCFHHLSDAVALLHSFDESKSRLTTECRPQTLVCCRLPDAPEAYRRCRSGLIDDYVVVSPLLDECKVRLAVYQALSRPMPANIQGPRATSDAVEIDRLSTGKDLPLPTGEPNGIAADNRILIVEDDYLIRKSYETLLDPSEYGYEIVASGDEALDSAEACKPSMVLMDIHLPGESGIEILREFRRRDRFLQLPIIMVTSNRDQEIVETCRAAGADSYIAKPLRKNVLLHRIGKFMSPVS